MVESVRKQTLPSLHPPRRFRNQKGEIEGVINYARPDVCERVVVNFDDAAAPLRTYRMAVSCQLLFLTLQPETLHRIRLHYNDRIGT